MKNGRFCAILLTKDAYQMPFAIEGESIILKTVYASRKATKHYLGREYNYEQKDR